MEKVDIEKTYYRYWGKWNKKDGTYHLLVYHCLDVAAVGFHILHPTTRRNQDLSRSTGISPKLVQYLFVLILVLHDLGKFSTAFQGLIEPLFLKLFRDKKRKEYSKRHDTLGFILWREVIKNEIVDQNPMLAKMLDHIIKAGCGHHGIPPKESAQHGNAILRCDRFFDQSDIVAALAFVQECFSLLPTAPSMPDLEKEQKQIFKYASWQFAGASILADWVGSNIDFFPYNFEQIPLVEYWNKIALPHAVKAVSTIGWHDRGIRPFSRTIDLFPFIEQPTPLQKFVAETELQPGPKLWVIEDVTGAGKTEAALILAQRMMGAGNADGIYLGLPTMATANAMYARLQKAYDKLYSEGERPSLVLSHGTRHLSEKFTDSIGVPKHHDDSSYGKEESASSYCNEWIADNRKKALLADVGVGTIDQALLSVLPARHQSLRMIGLHRKILIVDEVHAYDSYVEHLLGVLIEAHARNGGSVILLSATIPLQIRQKLIADFKAGLGTPETDDKITENGFPLVTQVSASGVNIWCTIPEPGDERVRKMGMGIEFLHDREKVFEKIIKAASEGQCVCWIRNTVGDARKAFYELLKRRIAPDKTDLFHSRFAMIDRSRVENAALHNFGKKSGPTERTGRILIATQVVEQSLDLDFDCMVSDLAPIDLIIQRAGRVHRHVRDKNGTVKQEPGAKDERSAPVITIFAPDFLLKPDSSWLSGEFKGTSAVYKHVGRLWLTQKMLKEKSETGGWSMPNDARLLIDSVYSEMADSSIPDGLQSATIRAQGLQQAQVGMGHLNALILKKGYCRDAVQADQWNEDDKIQTRLSEESREIVLAVYIDGILSPYADLENHAWDWSTLSVSQTAWNQNNYSIPQEYIAVVEELKKQTPRLKYSDVVVVNERSTIALSFNKSISNHYSPRFGWGANLNEEE